MDNSLFNVEWTTGDLNIKAVSVVAKYLGIVAAAVISIVGFGIVWAAILKNAMSGLYAVAPKFWDRVDEVKKAGIRNGEAAGKIAQGNNEVMKLLGSVTGVLLSICPNVKAMTDFDTEMLDAKAYFMRSIPLMCLSIFIGVFIFFGYPSQVAEKVSEFGTGIFDVVLTNIDPHEWVESLPDKLAVLKFSTDGSMNEFDKCVNKVARKAATTYVGTVEMTKEKRLDAALAIESWVITQMQECSEYCDSDKYDMSVTATIYKTANYPDVSTVNGQVQDGNAQFAWVVGCTDVFTPNTANDEEVAGWTMRVDVRFTGKASSGETSNADVTMSVPSNMFAVGDTQITITYSDAVTSGYGFAAKSAARGNAITSDGEEIEVSISVTSTTITIKPKSSKNSLSNVVSISDVQGLQYKYGSSANSIREIVTGSGEITFSTESGGSFKFGDDPAGSSGSSDSTGTSTSSSSGEGDL